METIEYDSIEEKGDGCLADIISKFISKNKSKENQILLWWEKIRNESYSILYS